MATQAPESAPDERVAPRLAFWLVLLGVPTLLLNRSVIPALPGSRSGIEHWLEPALAIGSVTSQLLALLITLLLIRLVVSSVGAAAIGALERLFVLPIGGSVGFFVVAASGGVLDSDLHLLLAAISGLGLLICSRSALRHASTRAGGILLLGIGAASILLATARLVAVNASLGALSHQYDQARGIASVGLLFKLLSIVWALIWTVLTSKRSVVIAVATAIAFTTLLLVWGSFGLHADGHFLPVLISRMLDALIREPVPFGPVQLGPAGDWLAALLGLTLLLDPKLNNAVERRAMALLLLGQCSLDVPMLAGIATSGALLLAWFAPHQMGDATVANRPKSSRSVVANAPHRGVTQDAATTSDP